MQKDMATPPDPVEGTVSSGTRMLRKVLKRCREEVKLPSLTIPVKKLGEMMVEAGLGARMTRRYCEILNMSVAEEEVDYRQFLLGMLFFLGRLGGVVGKRATFYDANKAQAMRLDFLSCLFSVYSVVENAERAVPRAVLEVIHDHLALLEPHFPCSQPEAQKIWGRGQDAPSDVEGGGSLTLQQFVIQVGDESNMPYVKVNSETLLDVEVVLVEGRERQSEEWIFSTNEGILLTHLEVGLREGLAKRVSDGGREASVLVTTGGGNQDVVEVKLSLGNHFRCCWPDLRLRPVSVGGGEGRGLTVRVSVPLSPLMPSVVLEPTAPGPLQQLARAGGSNSVAKKMGGNEEVGEKRKRPVHDGQDAEEATTFLMYDPSLSEDGIDGQGKEKGVVESSKVDTSLVGILGRQGSPWKLASHTVQLSRYQGTVDRFDDLWAPIRCVDASSPANLLGQENSAAPTTPRSVGSPWTPRSPCPLPNPPILTLSGSSRNGVAVAGEGDTGGRGTGGHLGQFDMGSTPNQLLEALKYFEMPLQGGKVSVPGTVGSGKSAFSWGHQPQSLMESLAGYIRSVAADVRAICMSEPRCLHLKAPCYILGDLHGNFQDLVAFEKSLWRIGIGLSPATFLFLGDYVDRGQYSVEVAIYLLAQKALFPRKVVLLRGNHETRSQNGFPGYSPCLRQSCIALFGEEVGTSVWEDINSVFDVIPMAAIIDGSVFCAHGGIPESSLLSPIKTQAQLVADICTIPAYLPEPDPNSEGGSALAWDLMWNDPSPQQNISGDQGGKPHSGFGPNLARGTAHVFTAEGLDLFLNEYGLTHLVRAHEVRQTGFQVQQHSRMVTLFSSSGYCGSTNDASCILASEGKLRFIRLEHKYRPGVSSLATKAAAASSLAAHLLEAGLGNVSDAGGRSSPVLSPILSMPAGGMKAVIGGKGGDGGITEISPRKRLQMQMQRRLHLKALEADVNAATILAGGIGPDEDSWDDKDKNMVYALAQAAVTHQYAEKVGDSGEGDTEGAQQLATAHLPLGRPTSV